MDRPPAKIVKPPQAYWDIIEIAVEIAEANPDASDRFLDATQQTFQRLASYPRIGRPYALDAPGLTEVRVLAVQGFRHYLIFYRVVGEEVHLLRIVHAARDLPTLLEETVLPED